MCMGFSLRARRAFPPRALGGGLENLTPPCVCRVTPCVAPGSVSSVRKNETLLQNLGNRHRQKGKGKDNPGIPPSAFVSSPFYFPPFFLLFFFLFSFPLRSPLKSPYDTNASLPSLSGSCTGTGTERGGAAEAAATDIHRLVHIRPERSPVSTF